MNIELEVFLGESGDCALQSMFFSGVFEAYAIPKLDESFTVQTIAGA